MTPNRRRRLALLAPAAVLLLAGALSWGSARRAAAAELAAASAGRHAVADASRRRGADVAFYERRASEDSLGAFDRAQLASLYLQRARETGDYADVARGETAARASLAIRDNRNTAARGALVAALLNEHRFEEARDAARALVADEPAIAAFRATLGEVALELGDYDEARASFDAIRGADRRSLAVAPRLARWLELTGDGRVARRMLYAATAQADSFAEISPEQRAWFHLRAADFDARAGRLDDAERALRGGRAASPGDYRLLALAARIAALRHDWPRAIALGDSTIAVTLDPATIGVVADAYAALGDTAKAAEYERAMEVAVTQQPGAYHRAWSLFLLDHGRRLPEVTAQIEGELRTRRDVYGYDLLGWARYRAGRFVEARRAAAKALSLGTDDAVLFYHAGMIERAAGRPAMARFYLARALDRDGTFDPTHPAAARATLDSLEREGAGR